jgi:hypothetical protein
MSMVVNVQKVSDGVSEVELPQACVVCGGNLHVRLTRDEAISYCSVCHYIGKARATVKDDGLRVDFRVSGRA